MKRAVAIALVALAGCAGQQTYEPVTDVKQVKLPPLTEEQLRERDEIYLRCKALHPTQYGLQGGCRRNQIAGREAFGAMVANAFSRNDVRLALRQCEIRHAGDYSLMAGCGRNELRAEETLNALERQSAAHGEVIAQCYEQHRPSLSLTRGCATNALGG